MDRSALAPTFPHVAGPSAREPAPACRRRDARPFVGVQPQTWVHPHIPPKAYRGLMQDINKATEEVVAEAKEMIKHPDTGGRGKKTPLSHNGVSRQGTSADYLARRLARNRPDILERMKAGSYTSVRAAAKAAGIVRLRALLLPRLRHIAHVSSLPLGSRDGGASARQCPLVGHQALPSGRSSGRWVGLGLVPSGRAHPPRRGRGGGEAVATRRTPPPGGGRGVHGYHSMDHASLILPSTFILPLDGA